MYLIYTRISRDMDGDRLGVQRQETACREYAAHNGLQVAGVLCDNDISAVSGKNRPAFRELLTRLREPGIDGVIVWHSDRLYRRGRDLEPIIDVVKETGAKILTVQAGPIDLNTATGILMAEQLAAFGHYEVNHMIERVKLSQSSRAVKGEWRTGTPPFGYRNAEKGNLRIVEDEAREVRRMARELLDGATVLSLSRGMNERGFTTSQGNQWRAGTVRRVLTTPTIAGLSHHHGEILGPALWDGILDEATWKACCAVLSDPKRRTNQGIERRYQGVGVYRCGLCGGLMRTTLKGGASKDRKGRSYQCRDCQRLTRNMPKTDELVDAVILGVLDMPENRLMAANRDTTAGEDVAALLSERNALTARKNELGALYASGTIDAAVLASGSAQFKQDIDRLDKRITAARTVSPVADLLLSGEELRDRWAAMSADKRAQVIDALVTVTILPAGRGPRFDPSKIQIEWKTPPV